MKVGDLVRLSSYGKQRKRAGWIKHDDVGIIVKKTGYMRYPDEYLVEWQRSDWRTAFRRWTHERHNVRADLRYARL